MMTLISLLLIVMGDAFKISISSNKLVVDFKILRGLSSFIYKLEIKIF
ncbi:hypothetical protein B0O79_3546 [Flavobacteriaceae bacterium MAR_2009_75]|nr:hypothetical protein B0O79_3546 [Flavobacteriaceae bacterium MAR_2009_75]